MIIVEREEHKMSATVILLIFLAVVISLPLLAIGGKLGKQKAQSLPITNPAAQPASPVPTATQPAATQPPQPARRTNWLAEIVAVAIMGGLVALLFSGSYWVYVTALTKIKEVSSQQPNGTVVGWGDRQEIQVTKNPVQIDWVEGARRARFELAPGERPGTFFVESAGVTSRLRGTKDGTFRATLGASLKVWVEDRPLEIVIEWEKRRSL